MGVVSHLRKILLKLKIQKELAENEKTNGNKTINMMNDTNPLFNDYIASKLKYDIPYIIANNEVVASTPYGEDWEVIMSVEKNNKNGKYHFLHLEFMQVTTLTSIDVSYDTLEEALERFYTNKAPKIYELELLYINSSLVYNFTKRLIENLNINQVKRLREFVKKEFEQHLSIQIKSIENASGNGLQIIKLKKNLSSNNPIDNFLIGKLCVEGNSIIIKDENDNITYLTSNENLTIETENIKQEIYWYFKK